MFSVQAGTVLVEKLETIISCEIQNTKPRDSYDVYILCKLEANNIEIEQLKSAI